jgi:RNA recognition motif. (a.k.a. RRM, RBD, or RNP domain)
LAKELGVCLSQSYFGREDHVSRGSKPKGSPPAHYCSSNVVNDSASQQEQVCALLMQAMVRTKNNSESSTNNVSSSCVQTQATQSCDPIDDACSGCDTHDGNDQNDFSNRKYVTLYVGNLSYKASSGDVKKMFQSRLNINVDSAVIARSSEGTSRGCAFVTFRGGDYSQFKQRFKALNDKSILGRKVYVEVAKSQRRES